MGYVVLVALNLVVFPLQGEFVDCFRFGAVLFPALFALGDKLAAFPVWLRSGVLVGMLALNLAVTYAYAIGRWAY